MSPSTPTTNYGWLRFFYLVLAVVWMLTGIARVLTDGGWFGWASIALGIGFGFASALWFKKLRRGAGGSATSP
jgi:hypothetical protein